jgi:formylglycine-generating enzyme required for sulfatase activity
MRTLYVCWRFICLFTALPASGAELKISIPELPKEAGKSVIIELPGLPEKATKLQFVVVPGLGTVKPFLLSKFEVTQGQYQSLRATNPSIFKHGPNHPVENMAWQDAKDFCLKFNASLAPADKARVQLRLPMDAEWSVAVGLPEEMPGTPQQKSRKVKGVYPWGEGFPPTVVVGNYDDETRGKRYPSVAKKSHLVGYDDGYADTSPVGSYPPNEFGICDLGGNVWEWCEDWIDDEMNLRVVRGAGWWDHSEDQMVASYRGRVPVLRNAGAGFRVCLEVLSK